MAETTTFDLDELFRCCACKDDERGFAEGRFTSAANGYYRKHPPIGHGRELFFVSINPRSTNNAPMDWAMTDIENFRTLALNRYQDLPYIPTYGEPFYDIHHRICEAIFPGQPFENVVIVHELYLCASPNATGLPGSLSPCAGRYMWPHLLAACPRLIIAFGRDAAEFFCCGFGEDMILDLQKGSQTRVISLPFPKRFWTADFKACVSHWVKRCFAIGTSGPLPDRDFGNLQRSGRAKSYVLNPPTVEMLRCLNRLAPQARACIAIMQFGGKTAYKPTELKKLLEEHSTDQWTYRANAPLRTKQEPWHIFKYYRRRLIEAGAISEIC